MQSENAYPPMLVTPLGIVTEVKPLQPENARSLMRSPLVIVTVLSWLLLIWFAANAGIVAVSIGQPLNAESPMLVTPSGIVIEVKLAQPENARSLMRSPLVIVTVLSWLLLMWFAANAGIVAVSIGQPLNAESPMLVTLSGIVIEVKPVQPENAEPPILVTLAGIVIEVKLTLSLNAYSPIPVTVSGIVMVLMYEC